MKATTYTNRRSSPGFTAGKSASADLLPVVAARGFFMEGDMCGYMREAMERDGRVIETELGELMHERRVCLMAIEHEQQAVADITEKIEVLKGELGR